MNPNSKSNSKKALNNFKMEISTELGHDYDNSNNKVTSKYSQDTLDDHAKNLLSGDKAYNMEGTKPYAGGERSVEGGEKMLVSKYYSQNNIK
ncbi:hypothetical protein [Romboutsia sp. 1001713B170131_170501_G6]|uniref:hypothetical protein n=1 Tax=Romboutsia sp. 1001713B170131_170501_G6 TaxID=2787108 RepID=UPI0018AAB1DC|nr:hypothetical protein [Romboutsia sp. 1001713B170131_170501_G6]